MRRALVAVAVAVALSSATDGLAASAPATLTTFAGRWTGHTRFLTVHRNGRATEVIYSGCCSPVLNLTLTLSRPSGTPANATVRVRVTGVWLRSGADSADRRGAPRVGASADLRLRHAVIYEPFTKTDYCSAGGSKCGA
jgi:hypothetical protein